MEAGQWSTLEVAKLTVAVAGPIAVAVVGFYVARALKRVEDAQWATRTLVERRLDVFESMTLPLNDIYCFFLAVGHFRDVSPPGAIDAKRTLDKLFYTHEALMSAELRRAYQQFMRACFDIFTGVGRDAKLRTSWKRQSQERREAWDEAWRPMFVEDARVASPSEVKDSYRALMDAFAQDVGATRA